MAIHPALENRIIEIAELASRPVVDVGNRTLGKQLQDLVEFAGLQCPPTRSKRTNCEAASRTWMKVTSCCSRTDSSVRQSCSESSPPAWVTTRSRFSSRRSAKIGSSDLLSAGPPLSKISRNVPGGKYGRCVKKRISPARGRMGFRRLSAGSIICRAPTDRLAKPNHASGTLRRLGSRPERGEPERRSGSAVARRPAASAERGRRGPTVPPHLRRTRSPDRRHQEDAYSATLHSLTLSPILACSDSPGTYS